MGKVKKYCVDCGSRLEFDEVIKGHKVRNEYRKNLYHCTYCSEKKGHDVIIAITRKKIPQNKFWESIDTIVFDSN